MDPIPAAVKASVSALIEKAERVNLVQSVKQILAELASAGLVYQMKLLPKLVGCHPINRDGFGISPSAVHELASSIFSLGFDHGETRCVCVEVRPGDTDINKFNEDMVAMSAGKLAALESEVRYASLCGGHTNQVLRCIAAGVCHDDERMTHHGALCVDKIRSVDSIYADAATHGMNWTVLNYRVPEVFPTLPQLIQASGNATTQISKGEHELQVLRKLWLGYIRELREHPNKPVDFSIVKQRVCQSKPACVRSIPAMYQFMLKYSGGSNALFLLETEMFIKQFGTNEASLTPELWESISIELKGAEQIIRFRHGLLKCLYVDTSAKVGPADARRFASKELMPKAIIGNDIMIDVRKALSDQSVALADVHQELGFFDINIVKWVLNKHKAASMQVIAAELFEAVRIKLNKPSLVSLWDAVVVAAVSGGSVASVVPTPSLREFTQDASLGNPCQVVVEKGFAVGMSIQRKADKVIGCIQSLAGDQVGVQTKDSLMQVAVGEFVDKLWVKYDDKSQLIEEVLDWQQYSSINSTEFKIMNIKAAVTQELFALVQKHEPTGDSLQLFSKPKKYAVVSSKIDKGKLILVAASLRIGSSRDGVVPSGSFGIGLVDGIAYFISPSVTFPGTRATPFIAPFWFMESSSDESAVNMEVSSSLIKVPDVGIFQIPVVKNICALLPGQKLIVLEKRAGEQPVAAAVPSSKPKGGSKGSKGGKTGGRHGCKPSTKRAKTG